ncbi:MAG TPA: FkbM family methyltransferase [Chitinophagales bacterium]|nr:FkbM family methyltransferase [Chitinophagales bacterium]
MNEGFEKFVKKIFNLLGFEITRRWNTPVGDVEFFLRDVKRRGLKCQYILDVGAYKGKFSRLAKSSYPESVIYMVEPLSEMRNYLEEFCRKYPESKYFDFAVGPVNGTRELRVFKDLAWSGFMEEDIPVRDKRTSRIVEMRTIDSMIQTRQMELPDLVKLDVQGYELEVLKGAERLFGKTELFIIEAALHNKHKSYPLIAEVVAYMNERDYLVYDFAGFLRQHHDGSLIECDLCFVKRNSFLRK